MTDTLHSTLRAANIARQAEWDPSDKLTLTYRLNELAGETGEACNVGKKLERERLGIRGSRDTIEHLAEELADVVICADLVAMAEGIDLDAAVAAKFNATSEKVGLATRLARPEAIASDWHDEAIGFLYALLGSEPQVSANILQANPEVRARLHRAIYERRPQDEPYDDMMARLLPDGLPQALEAEPTTRLAASGATPTGARAVIMDDQIVISIAIDALPLILSGSVASDAIDGLYKVTDAEAFAVEVCDALNQEAEDGTTRIHALFDSAFSHAIEQGGEGFEEVDEDEFEAEAERLQQSAREGQLV